MPLAKVTKRERTLHLKPGINKEIQYLLRKTEKLCRKYCVYNDSLEVITYTAPDED